MAKYYWNSFHQGEHVYTYSVYPSPKNNNKIISSWFCIYHNTVQKFPITSMYVMTHIHGSCILKLQYWIVMHRLNVLKSYKLQPILHLKNRWLSFFIYMVIITRLHSIYYQLWLNYILLPLLKHIYLNPLKTTCWLVKMSIQVYIEPIRECVGKNTLMCKFLILCYQSFIMIGLTNENFMILTNQKAC